MLCHSLSSDNIVMANRAWNRSARFRLTQWLKITPHIMSCYSCCCINEPVIFSHRVHLKLGHRFHALLTVNSDRDNTVPLSALSPWLLVTNVWTPATSIITVQIIHLYIVPIATTVLIISKTLLLNNSDILQFYTILKGKYLPTVITWIIWKFRHYNFTLITKLMNSGVPFLNSNCKLSYFS